MPADEEVGVVSSFSLTRDTPRSISTECANGRDLSAPCMWALTAEIYRMSHVNHRAYAAARGYRFLGKDACAPATRVSAPQSSPSVSAAVWAKVHLVRACMLAFPTLRYLLWIDADAIFVSPELSIQRRLLLDPPPGDECSLLAAEDLPPNPFNMGVFLARNDAPAALILDRLVAMSAQREHRFRKYWEQDGLRTLWLAGRDGSADAASAAAARHVCIVQPRRRLQSLVKLGEYQPAEDFIAHYTFMTRRGFLHFNQTVRRSMAPPGTE